MWQQKVHRKDWERSEKKGSSEPGWPPCRGQTLAWNCIRTRSSKATLALLWNEDGADARWRVERPRQQHAGCSEGGPAPSSSSSGGWGPHQAGRRWAAEGKEGGSRGPEEERGLWRPTVCTYPDPGRGYPPVLHPSSEGWRHSEAASTENLSPPLSVSRLSIISLLSLYHL